ncbi:MAG: tetratricopeptide repeat protein [Thermoanaerobaculia bacterium]
MRPPSEIPAVPSRGRRFLPAIALVAVALGLRWLYLHELARSDLGSVLLGDGIAYDAWARRIAAGDWRGHEVFYQAPLYPYFLGLLYSLFGPDPWVARIAQTLLGAAGCLLAARAGERLFGRRAGWIAGGVLAVYAPAIFFDGEIQKASLSLFLATLLLRLIVELQVAPRAERGGEARSGPSPVLALAAGAVTGLFALNRENALLLLPVLALWLAFAGRAAARRRLAAAALLLAGAFAVLLPVALRNRALGGELLPTTSQLGPNFYIGNHAGADGRYHPLRPGRGSARFERADATAIAVAAAGRALSPAEVSRFWLDRALGFVRAEPGRWLRLLGRKLWLTWNAREIVDTTSLEAAADSSRLLAALSPWANFGLLCPLAAAGFWIERRRWRALAILWIVLAAWTAAVAAFFVFARYRLPLVPILALFAGAGAAGGRAALRGRNWRGLAPAAALALAVALLVNWPADARDPRAVTYASLGSALVDAGRTEAGLGWLERAVELSPDFAEAHLSLAMSRLAAGDLDRAEAGLRRVLDLDPGSAEAWNDLGVIAARRDRAAEAESDFARAVTADGDSPKARFNLGRALAARGEVAAARAQFERLVELSPGDAEAHHQLAGLLAFGGDFAGARTHYERELELTPGRADAEFKLALALDRLGEGALAAARLRAALATTPAYSDRLLAEAERAAAAGRAGDAVRLARLLLAAAPGHSGALALLARLEPRGTAR